MRSMEIDVKNMFQDGIKRLVGDALTFKEIKKIYKKSKGLHIGQHFIIKRLNSDRLVIFQYGNSNKSDIYECKEDDINITISIVDKEIHHYVIDIKYLNINTKPPFNYLVYSHFCGLQTKTDQQAYYNYHGLTSRTMPIRLKEHYNANSNFGKALNKYSKHKLEHVHRVIKDGLTKDEAFNFEEKVIKANSLFRDGKGNNMIPGGYAGMRIAKRLGFKNKNDANEKLEEASDDSKKLHDICKRIYGWNELTKDQIKNIVCNNKNNFSEKEVAYIRIMSLQIESMREIYIEFRDEFNYNVMNLGLRKRVEDVVNGKTYRFVS